MITDADDEQRCAQCARSRTRGRASCDHHVAGGSRPAQSATWRAGGTDNIGQVELVTSSVFSSALWETNIPINSNVKKWPQGVRHVQVAIAEPGGGGSQGSSKLINFETRLWTRDT